MKSGISLVEMAKEIQRQAELKADYMMDTVARHAKRYYFVSQKVAVKSLGPYG